MFARFFEKRALQKLGAMQGLLQAQHGIKTYYERLELEPIIDSVGLSNGYKHLGYARYLNEEEFEKLEVGLRQGQKYDEAHSEVVGKLVGFANNFKPPKPPKYGSSGPGHDNLSDGSGPGYAAD